MLPNTLQRTGQAPNKGLSGPKVRSAKGEKPVPDHGSGSPWHDYLAGGSPSPSDRPPELTQPCRLTLRTWQGHWERRRPVVLRMGQHFKELMNQLEGTSGK